MLGCVSLERAKRARKGLGTGYSGGGGGLLGGSAKGPRMCWQGQVLRGVYVGLRMGLELGGGHVGRLC